VLAYPASLGRLVPAGARSNRQPRLWLHLLVSFSSADCCERRRCVPAIFGVRVAPARDETRSGSNNSERGPTSGRSTNYGSGHLVRVFRDIGRIFSLLFLLSHPSPLGQTLRGRGSRNMVSSKAKTVSIVFHAELTAVDESAACHSPKREPRPRALGRGLGNPLLVGCCGNDGRTNGRRPAAVHQSLPPPALPAVAVPHFCI
jgi:hypothetical protein